VEEETGKGRKGDILAKSSLKFGQSKGYATLI
jgi:hypothetical protein